MSVAVLKFLSWNLYVGPEINHEKSLGRQLHSTNNCYQLISEHFSSAQVSKQFSILNTNFYALCYMGVKNGLSY
jgi:hypothetical protein